jgi:diaminopimelate epimerase
MLEIDFAKMVGAGNDFIIINDYYGKLKVDLHAIARALCARRLGIGADGILFLRKSLDADFEMYYLNPDGSEAGMCGNGGRCIARFAVLNGICGRRLRFVSHGSMYYAEVFDSDSVKLYFPAPREIVPSKKIPMTKDDREIGKASSSNNREILDASYICPGTEHVVLTNGNGFETVDTADLVTIGREIRYNSEIFPDGTNVNLIEEVGENKIRMRTYERGVEGETLACGTGAVASAIAASLRYNMKSPISVLTTSGETLIVSFEKNGLQFSKVILEGSARMIFQGKVYYDEKSAKVSDFVDGKSKV